MKGQKRKQKTDGDNCKCATDVCEAWTVLYHLSVIVKFIWTESESDKFFLSKRKFFKI